MILLLSQKCFFPGSTGTLNLIGLTLYDYIAPFTQGPTVFGFGLCVCFNKLPRLSCLMTYEAG